MPFDVVELTRSLVDIPSVSGEEASVGNYLIERLSELTDRFFGSVEKMPVQDDRFNVFAQFGDKPVVVFSTHMDTVPPFIPSGEDDETVTGRGSCDAKGILAAMICAIEHLLQEGHSGLGLLVVVGEERGSAGAIAASKINKGARFLINGEPTENKLALGMKGCLRFVLTASGRMAHSAYPELGESAILKLLDALDRIRAVELPVDRVLGQSTVNIGTVSGGRAPNVIPDEASAELLVRLVDDGESTRTTYRNAVEGLCDLRETLYIAAMHLGAREGFETTSVSYTTDIPVFGPTWGEPYLLGPGTIDVAHTDFERVSKSDLMHAVGLYSKLAKELLSQ
jgi:acetylornithine deacetylase